ncbi:hypothetical protein RND81_09G000800 [Saponaria officinalis]|uniref:Myb/SANT-like domain-containing protein n=1 Tax=Saponaria officinalis TaxID=3572 RepID=A0AAW1IGY9_SAPOF
MDANSQSSFGGRGKNKRFWKKEEEEALIDCLLVLSADPQWKGEGVFKNGYSSQLEQMLNTKFPDKYAIVSELVNKTSGFQWDDQSKMIKCERQAYEDFCKTHPKAGGLWMTLFLYLDKLDEVFGVDRATGISSELPDDSITNLENETIDLDNDNSDDDNVYVYQSPLSFPTDDQPQPPPTKKMKKEKTPKGSEKKRSAKFADLTTLDQMTTATIANAMSTTQEREMEVVEHKKMLLFEIASLPGITQAEAIRAARLFSSNPSQMDVLFSSPNDDWKKEVVLDMLSRNG